MSVTKTVKYSPGPWTRVTGRTPQIQSSDGCIIASIISDVADGDPGCNVCLMGHALEMYEAIEAFENGQGTDKLREVYASMQEPEPEAVE